MNPNESNVRCKPESEFDLTLLAKRADPYVYPGTGILINKPGIRNEAVFKQFEYEQSGTRSMELCDMVPPAKFSIGHLKAIHQHLFQDVYDWAGQSRTTDLSKGGSTFARPANFGDRAKKFDSIFSDPQAMHGLEKPRVVARLATAFADLNSMHLFREGNGRAIREFISQMAHAAGFELDQRLIDNDKNQWNEASKKSANGDIEPIKAFFAKALRPAHSVAFEMFPRAAALEIYPGLQSSYDALDSTILALQLKYPTNPKALEHFTNQARTETLRKLSCEL